MKNKIKKLTEYLIYLFVFLLPWQIVWIIADRFIDGFKWYQGTILLYGTEIFLWFIVFVWLVFEKENK